MNMKKLVVLLLVLVFPLAVYAADDINLSCDKDTSIAINESIICRVSLKTGKNFNKISFEINSSDGLEITDVRSNYEKLWHISKDKNLITVTSDEVQYGLQEFGIILVKALKDGNHELTLKDIKIINSLSEEIEETSLEDTTKNLKVLSSDNYLKSIKIDEKEIDFNPNIYSYNLIIKDNSEIKIEAEASNEFATINGTGTFKLSEDVTRFVYPIEVISEDGFSRIYVINLERENSTNPDNKQLDGVSIKNDKGNNLLISFNPSTYEYNIDVDTNSKYLEFKPELNIEGASLVKDFGNQKITLKPGNNIALIKVMDSNKDILTYIFNITKPIANKSNNNYLKSLTIEGYDLKFSKRIKNYTLEIDPKDTKLNITPVLEHAKARYIISGNSNLKNGSVIKIEVTAENEEKAIYRINIKEKEVNYSGGIIIIIAALLILYTIYLLKDKIFAVFKKKPKTIYQKKTVKKEPLDKIITNSTSTRNPRNSYTKKTTSKKKKTTKKVTPKKVTTSEDKPKLSIFTKKDTPKEDKPKLSIFTKKEKAKEEKPKVNIFTKSDTPKKEVPKVEPVVEPKKEVTPPKEVVKEEVKKEPPKKENSNVVNLNKVPTKKKPPVKKEEPKKTKPKVDIFAKKDAPKKEEPKAEVVKKEEPKKAPPKKKRTKSGTPKVVDLNKTIPKKSAKKAITDTPKSASKKTTTTKKKASKK